MCSSLNYCLAQSVYKNVGIPIEFKQNIKLRYKYNNNWIVYAIEAEKKSKQTYVREQYIRRTDVECCDYWYLMNERMNAVPSSGAYSTDIVCVSASMNVRIFFHCIFFGFSPVARLGLENERGEIVTKTSIGVSRYFFGESISLFRPMSFVMFAWFFSTVWKVCFQCFFVIVFGSW